MNEIYISHQLKTEAHFSGYMAAQVLFAINFKGEWFYRPVWFYFIDGYEAKHAFTLN